MKKKWEEGDGKACTQIELSIGNAEIIHISGVITASQMWEQLHMHGEGIQGLTRSIGH